MKNGDKAMVIEEELQPKAMITLIEHLELMISSRMHQLMFSAMATTPFVGISRCDKTDSFLSLFNMTAASSTQNCTLARLQPVLESTWRQKEKLRIHIQSVTKNIYARSLETQELVKECLDNMDESSHPERSFVKRLHYLWMAFFMRLGKGER
jgi:polysaccharide pyruvyl transferase WcaK-like protein